MYIDTHTHIMYKLQKIKDKVLEEAGDRGEENLAHRKTKEKNYIRHQKPCEEKEWDTIFQVLNIKCQ